VAQSASLILTDPQATAGEGARLAAAVQAARPVNLVVHLEGELGSGKTTLARGFLEALGHTGRVPSPTYTLVEPYLLSGYRIYHVDLYRVREPRELEHLGLTDQLGPGSLALIEWAAHGGDWLPAPDIRLRLDHLEAGRSLRWEALTEPGRRVLARLALAGTPPPTHSAS
jgi:tRNA threonylcarbamoyladenosine biosynthesis protein TsaE